MTKKIGRVPNVLWKQFRDKAATLSNTIIKIIPNSCNCNSKGKCIRCIFGNSEEAAMSYLIRPNDPSDYIDMMTNSWFVVVPPDAPTLSPLLTFTRHWSQLQIVERSIQTFFSKDISPSNVICQGYQKFKLHSTTVKVLTNWTWELALKRVGDSVMLYLLMHTLVFMPIRGNAHQQVVGPHVNRLFAKFPMHIPLDDVGSSMHARKRQKRRRGNGEVSKPEEPASKVPCITNQQNVLGSVSSKNDDYLGTHCPKESALISEDCLHGHHVPEEKPIEKLKVRPGKRLRLPSWQRRKRNKRLRLQDCCTEELSKKVLGSKVPFNTSQQNVLGSVSSKNDDYLGTHCPKESALVSEDCSYGHHFPEEQPIEKLKVRPGKRLRLPSWQRRKRYKRLRFQDCCTQELSKKVLNDEDDLRKTCPHGLVKTNDQLLVVPTSDKSIHNLDGAGLKSEKPMQLCLCCSVFQSLSKIPKDAEINRKLTFYNLKSSSSLFLKMHVLYSLKCGFTGINDLLKHIFGLNMSTQNLPASCFHKRGLCSHASSCLYHSFVKLLKVFRRRTKICQHINLLEKHCSSQPLFQFGGDKDVSSSLQASTMESDLSRSKQDVNQVIDQMPKRRTLSKRDRKQRREVVQCQFGISRPYCLKDEVVSFIWAVCRNIIPPDLLGLPANRRSLRRNISRFIRLRRFEKFSLKQCMHKLEAPKFPLLSNMESCKSCNSFSFAKIPGLLPESQNTARCDLKQMLLERWIFWVFTHIVVPLVQANFYVTESEHGRQNLYYYRKTAWKKLSDRAATLLKKQSYRSLDNASLASILRKRSFGFSKVRLCPKESGARPIANLKAPSRFFFKRSLSCAEFRKKKRKGRAHRRKASFFKSVNTVLRDLHVILKDLKVKEPERWGSTVFSYGDIHRKLCSFLRHLKEGKPTMPMVFFVVADVQKAFDTVNQDKLLSILSEIQIANKYSFQKSCEIFCRKKSLWIFENRKLMSEGNNSESTKDIPPVRQKTCQTVVVNQKQIITVRRKELKFNLEEHLKNNVLKLGRRFYLQTVGIPQGSVLSTLLCTLYYGHMERNKVFPYLSLCGRDANNGCAALEATPDVPFSSPEYLLLRFVDDFLFVSTSKKQASSFFSRLRRGFREYNCYMNQDKFCMNFDPDSTHKPDSKRLLVGSNGVSFMKWSGLLINCRTFEVQADYTRYHNDHLSSTLTVSWQHRPGRQLKAKLRAYVRPKCHPIFYDSCLNSPAIIRLNVYQAFVVCAMKFHCYVRELSFWCKVTSGSCLYSIEGSIRYMYKLMRRKMYRVVCTPDCHKPHRVLKVAKKEVTWLGLKAYIRVLSKKKSRHFELLRLLRTKLATLSNIGGSSALKYAVDDCHSSIMWEIKY